MKKKILSCLVALMTMCVSYAQNHQLWVGESLTCDISSAVMGSVTDMNWSTSGGYISLTGSGFYRNAQVTQYFSGTATVTCSWYYTLYYGGSRTRMSKTWTIACLDNPAKLVPTSMTMVAGGTTRKLSCTLTYTNSYSSYADIYFQSGDPSIATVDQYTGVVTPISAGTTYITAYSKVSANSPYCTVTVTSGSEPTSISLSKSSLSLEEGESENLTYSITPSNATTTVTWSSDNTSVATVNSAGVVTAVSAGSATITAKTSNNKIATCIVSVNAAPVSLTSISIYPSSLTVERGKSFTITATLNPNGATATLRWGTTTDVLTINNGTLVSSSGNAGIYELTDNSLTANVTAVGEGTAVILVVPTEGLIAAQCVVTVVPATSPTSLSLYPSSMTLDVGEYRYINETFYPEGTTADITWSSSNNSVATVNTLGKVTAVSSGYATITATTSNGLSATCAVTVNAASTLPTSISLSPTSMNLTVGEYKYIYESFYPEGSTADITWSSSNTSVATVNSVGKVTAVSAGSATITAKTSNNKTATCSVTVTAASTQPTSISVSPSSVNLEVGGTKNLTYTLSPSTATTTVTWSSSNTSVATVSSAGKVTAVSAGSATITAKTSNNKTATCAVTVQASPSVISPTGITIVPEYLILKVGGSKTLSYLLTPINATTTVTWESDDPSVATVSSTGYVKAKGEGSAIITARTSNNETATCYVDVFTSSNYTLTYEYDEYTSEAILTGSDGDPIVGSVTIPSYVTNPDDNKRYKVVGIGDWAFGGNGYGITAITLPTTITSIGNYAFEGCSSLTSITIPNSVTIIGERAFYGCSSMTSITIPNSVTSIGDEAFRECYSLTSIIIPNSVTGIEDGAFYRCTRLASVTIGNSAARIGYQAFYECSSLTSVTIPSSVTTISANAFGKCSSLASVTIPNSVTSIGDCAFSDCSGLTSMTIPNSVTSIGDAPFYNCSSLTSIDVESDNQNYCSMDGVLLNKNLTTLIQYPCGKQGEYVIPNSVTSIGDWAFSRCSSLTSITIPSGVASIGESAFSRCSSLSSVTNNAITPQSIYSYTFFEVDKTACTLYVPKESVDLYNVADEWKDFGTIIGIESPQGIENIQGDNVQCTKVLRDGQIYILRGDKTYTVTGQEVK